MIGMTLIADGLGFHVPKGYVYAAMAFSGLVEALNMLARRKRRIDREKAAASGTSHPEKVPAQAHGGPPTVT